MTHQTKPSANIFVWCKHSVSTPAQILPRGWDIMVQVPTGSGKEGNRAIHLQKGHSCRCGQSYSQHFLRLGRSQLLERCLLGATQNRNEATHHTLWRLCSKAEFQSKPTIEFSVALVATWWNNGASSLLIILKRLSVEPGIQTEQDWKRISSHSNNL